MADFRSPPYTVGGRRTTSVVAGGSKYRKAIIEPRQVARRLGREGVGRRVSVGEQLTADVKGGESFIKSTIKPITQSLPKAPRAIGLGAKSGRIARSASSSLLDLHLNEGGAAAKGYLAKKAATKVSGMAAAKSAGEFIAKDLAPTVAVADLAYQTGKVGYGLYQIGKAKKQQKEAEAGTAWIKQQMGKSK